MKIFNINQKVIYFLSCVLIAFSLYGCKEKELKVSVFDGLPESTFLTEAKTSLENHIPLAVAFTAEWCPHCRKYKPVFNAVKERYRGKVTFINIDVDDTNGSPISNRFQVRGIPTSAFIRADGSVLKMKVGEIEENELIQLADELIVSKKRKSDEPVAPFPLDLNNEEAKQQPVKEEVKEEQAKPTEEIKPEEKKPPEDTDTGNTGEDFKEDIPMPQEDVMDGFPSQDPVPPPLPEFPLDNKGAEPDSGSEAPVEDKALDSESEN